MSNPSFNDGEFAGIDPLEFERVEFRPPSNSIEFDGIETIATVRLWP